MKKKHGLLRGLAAAGTAGFLLDMGAAELLFSRFFCRPKAGAAPFLDIWGSKEDPFEPYRHEIAEGREWLRETEKVSEYWRISSHDALTLEARFIPADAESDRAVICVHGYMASGERDYAVMAKALHEAGYHVLLIDQRAHGHSEGKYLGFGCLEREDLYRWIRRMDRHFDGKCSIYLHGISMGSATVLMTSALNLPPSVKGITADCGYTSPEAVMKKVAVKKKGTELIVESLLALLDGICRRRAGYSLKEGSALKAVASASCPIFLIHGDRDQLIPVEMARELYRACRSQKGLWIVRGANHAESFYLEPEEYMRRMLAFFDACAAQTE